MERMSEIIFHLHYNKMVFIEVLQLLVLLIGILRLH